MYAFMKKRIAHFMTSFELGGVQTVVDNLALGLRSEFETIVCALDGFHGGYVPRGEISYLQFGLADYKTLYRLLSVTSFLRKEHIDLLHGHPGTLSRIAGVMAGVPVIISTLHGSLPESGLLLGCLHKSLSFKTEVFVANSIHTSNSYLSLIGIPQGKCRIIYNGVDISLFGPVDPARRRIRRSYYGVPRRSPLIVTSGRLHPDKGMDVFICAASMVLRTLPRSLFFIVGEGQALGNLKSQVTRLGIDKSVRFIGARMDVRPFIEGADIFVLPSAIREGFGLSLAEAMAMGVPVIGTKLGGVPEIIIDGVNGLLAEPGNSESLAQSILYLLASQDLARFLAQNGLRTIREQFSLDRMISKYKELYRALL
jgi:glycosyltransferase involved in cell wall biosynthesis